MKVFATFNRWPCFVSTILFCCRVFIHDVWCIIFLL